ncbi:hypothetical protein KOI35_26770 [Actinoplanes bogorensis]|uniref:Nitroreductase n=1 Tax=Paractinoplanes bogorensis TaxID=1610840 RepID=A0ABS5YVL9_9ACTN|nr:hypothetical protein [Actinoplanes bogorensis]MBU2667116.1 hypothetical protein [Actinoplanes bogorensis]
MEFRDALRGRRMVRDYRTDPATRAALAAVAGLPGDVAVAGVMTLGYPADDPGVPTAKVARRRKPLDELVTWRRDGQGGREQC